MDYGKDIIQILMAVPDGLSIRKIVRHVYNAHNSLFETVDLEEVKRSVTQYLASNSKKKGSPIEHTGERGVYRINMRALPLEESMLEFKDYDCDDDAGTVVRQDVVDMTPDMFEGMY